MTCQYCAWIHEQDRTYPVRTGTRDLDSEVPRCDWHWRFTCDVCGRPSHFNGVTWCDATRQFICLWCAPHRLQEDRFWCWDDYYALVCPHCHEHHPALDRLEYLGRHPWQRYPQLAAARSGLSREQDTSRRGVTGQVIPHERVITDETVAARWNAVADRWFRRYSEFGDLNRQYIIDPAVLGMLGDVAENRILDAGCGNGYLCRRLAKRGAEMVGVDLSTRAIELAERAEQEAPLNIAYHIGSLGHLSMCADAAFDAVVSNLVLQDLQDLDGALRELHRVLKPGGQLVFSIMHPCFSSPPVHGWVRRPVDSHRREDWLHWKVDSYFDRGIEEWTLSDWPPLYHFHRTLADYVHALLRNGFVLAGLDEPVPTEEDVAVQYRYLNDGERVPLFLVMAARKTEG